MPKKYKVKRYSSIYNRSKKRRSLAFQIIMSVVVFVAIALIVYLISIGVNSYINRESYIELDSSILGTPSDAINTSDDKCQNTNEKIIASEISASSIENKSYITEFIKKAKDEGKNSIVVPLKTKDGSILYSTNVQKAKSWETIADSPIDALSLATKIKDVGLVPIAKISAFYDQIAPHAKRENSYYQGSQKTTTHLFKNSVTKKTERWLNPYKEVARKYICDIVAELGNLGYSYVLVDNVAFPDVEFDSSVGTDANGKSKSEILKTFIKELDNTKVPTIISYDWSAIGGGKSADIIYGGDISTYGITHQAPTINISKPPTGLSEKNEIIKSAID
ncbi:MAG: putative glycoside hydrolase, partial [Oscillospiraceae bacterium]|nr:putative glycoside hydrolase [Oscillospiraceae bacterium]